MDDQFKLMREYMGDEFVKWVLIPIKLREYLKTKPIKKNEGENFDLNPHLNITYACKVVAQQVTDEGIQCTQGEVMECWLTIAVYHGELLAR
jgi:hypothetical protein